MLFCLLGAMVVAIGNAATGVFCTSDTPWAAVESAGHYTGDRMWRFPLWNCYSSLLQGTPQHKMCISLLTLFNVYLFIYFGYFSIIGYSGFDLDNIGKGKGGGACTAAAFLKV